MEICKIHTFDQGYYSEIEDAEGEINEMLADGWKTKFAIPFNSKDTSDYSAVLIIYEKPEENKKEID